MSEVYNQVKGKFPSQKNRILTMLREAGVKGVTNIQLQKVAMRFGHPLHMLYMEGYKIENIHLGDGLCKYVLVKEPDAIKPTPKKATDILFEQINRRYSGTVTVEQLNELLSKLNYNVIRRSGSFKNEPVA